MVHWALGIPVRSRCAPHPIVHHLIAHTTCLALPVIVTGVALAIAAVYQSQSPHLADTHMKWGVAIFVLYFAQLIVGALVHWMRPKSAKPGLRRPLQNYFHAIFGLFIIAISFYQVSDRRHHVRHIVLIISLTGPYWL